MAFTYVGPSVGATLVVGAFNEQLAVAQDRLRKADNYTAAALGAITNAPTVQEVDLQADVDIPPAPTIEGFTSVEVQALYDSTADEIKAMLADGLTAFFTEFFPLGDEMAMTQAWLQRVLTTGGSGLAPHIEDQIWQRERARLLKDAARASTEAMSTWAARGYPLPPGALVGQMAAIEQDARDKVAQSSRDRAIEQAKMELENIRFAVDKAIALRTTAIQAASDYLRTLALGPQLGVQLATSLVEAKAKMAQAVTAAYSAQIAALELPVKVAIADATLDVDVRKANLSAAVATIENRTRTVQAAAQSVGTQASAALNSLSAQAQFNGSDAYASFPTTT